MYIVPSMMCKMYVVLDFNDNYHPAPCLDVTGLAPINNPVVDNSDLDTPSNAGQILRPSVDRSRPPLVALHNGSKLEILRTEPVEAKSRDQDQLDTQKRLDEGIISQT